MSASESDERVIDVGIDDGYAAIKLAWNDQSGQLMTFSIPSRARQGSLGVGSLTSDQTVGDTGQKGSALPSHPVSKERKRAFRTTTCLLWRGSCRIMPSFVPDLQGDPSALPRGFLSTGISEMEKRRRRGRQKNQEFGPAGRPAGWWKDGPGRSSPSVRPGTRCSSRLVRRGKQKTGRRDRNRRYWRTNDRYFRRIPRTFKGED